MHGTGQFSSFITLNLGGTVATLPSRKFNAIELLERGRAAARRDGIVIVGLAFSTPMLEALEANPGRWDLSSVQLDELVRLDVEPGEQARPAQPLPQRDDLRQLRLVGGGGPGRVGLGAGRGGADGRLHDRPELRGLHRGRPRASSRARASAAWWRSPASCRWATTRTTRRPAKTFKTLEGVRWSVPGDWAEVNTDGTLKLLGRGSVCINTGGEKVFPEEVEEALKTHPGVRDAVVVGVPDARFGERICAVVETDGCVAADPGRALRARAAELAGYKAPRDLVLVDTIGRAPNGKVDYAAIKARALDHTARYRHSVV